MPTDSLLGEKRRILAVVGPHSGCGKTTFVLHLLRYIAGLGCLKVSPSHDWDAQIVSDAEVLEEDFYLEGSSRLERPGKDTALYMAAGALEVKRLRHRGDGLAKGLRAALERYPAEMPITVESSSALCWLNPAAIVLVVRLPIEEMKPATEALLSRVTDLLINAPDTVDRASSAEGLTADFPALSPQFTWSADLIAQPPPEAMLTRVRTLLTTEG
ncbi:MAG: hypothetical protein JSU63_17310 [Phycisphaerales bacterium]|nr:MAG: hypothetical protein JSU63_17310 [Phycisphaerales bacterium]